MSPSSGQSTQTTLAGQQVTTNLRSKKEKNIALPKLKERGLKKIEVKIEEYLVKKSRPEDWKKCKILGSLIDTNKDIKRWKQLTKNAMKTLIRQKQPQHPIEDQSVQSMSRKHISIQLRTMAMTKTAEKKIDSYHRRILRKAIKG